AMAGFVATLAEGIRQAVEEAARHGRPRVLFSAHGVPKKFVVDGDPYEDQDERTAVALREAIGAPDIETVVCYQRRVGRLEWLGPFTEDEIRRAGSDGVPLVVVPVAFVSEHSETLVELDMIY